MLFATLFGPKAASDLEEQEEEEAVEGEDEDEKLTKETSQERAERALFFQRRADETAVAFAARIFGRAYGTDIERLVRMDKLWDKPGRKAPTPLPPIAPDVASHVAGLATPALVSASACSSLGLKDPNALWTVPEAASVFLLSCARLAERQASLGGVPLAFDKDDGLACEMVAAAALLRGSNYGIPGQSLFAAKGMAGNIIHAIATTNAIISGLIVLQAVTLLRGQRTGLHNVYLARIPSHTRRKGSRLLMPEACDGPVPGCFVCGRQRMRVSLDLATWTVGALIDKVLIPKFAMQMPVLMGGHNGGFYFEHDTEGLDEEELADNARVRSRTLATAPGGGLKDGDIVQLLDDTSSLKFEIQLVHRTQWDAATEPDGFLVSGEIQAPVQAAPQETPAEAAAPAAAAGDDDILVMDDEAVPQPGAGAKRKRGAEDGEHADAGPAKKHAADEGDDVIVL
jgi:ubiquitin-like 1-activating enzyme E1 B